MSTVLLLMMRTKRLKMYLRFVGLGIQNLTFYKNRQSATVFVET